MPELQGTGVIFRRWPASSPRGVLLLAHGLGAHSARWNFLADFFLNQGISSYAIELKGFGLTKERPAGHIGSFNLYYQDILQLLGIIMAENPGRPVFLLGESLGGLIAFILGGLYPKDFKGVICLSPAFKNGMKFPLSSYFAAFSSLLYNQKRLIKMPFNSAMCTRDRAYQKIMDANPAEIRVASARLLFEILLAQLRAKGLAKNYPLPVLFLLSGKDQLVDAKASRQVFASIGNKDKTMTNYPEMFHALSIDLDREKVFADALSWLNPRL